MDIREKIKEILDGKVSVVCIGEEEVLESRKILDDLVGELENAFEKYAEEKYCINCISNRGF